MQICEDGLERLFEVTTATTRHSLIDKIKPELEVLMRTELVGYLEFKDGKYRATAKFKEYPKTRQAIAAKLQEWANPTQRTVEDFGART
jgi:hypothetical protein